MSNEELMEAAKGVLRPRLKKDRWFGDVGAALWSAHGVLHLGVSVDTPGWGLCAERSALAAMITAGEDVVRKLVAVWRDPETGLLHVLPPCGLCREFLRSVDETNLRAEIVLGPDTSATLAELLPAHRWPGPVSQER